MIPSLLHQLLTQSAEREPDRCALVSDKGTLSYAELTMQSDRLAHALRSQGVTAGDRVGVALDKSLESVIAIFGILKAGAAYVPIDPSAPANRAAYIVENCAMRGLITTRKRLAALEPLVAKMPPCVVLDAGGESRGLAWNEIMQATTPPQPDPGVVEQDLAYILYTSGSTGEPKGVMLSHRAALSFVNWAVDYFQLHQDDRLSNHAPLHFDLSIFDLFGAVAVGATVALVSPTTAVFPRNLADWIEDTGISVWYSVPSALIQLALNGGLERHDFKALRLVIFAGEVFPIRHLRALMQQIPGAGYFNLYGPTETNVCTVHPVSTIPTADAAPLPIGRACANTEVFALSDDGVLIEAGGTGELYVRGPTLMQGYWGKPDQSGRVLLPNPLNSERPDLVYRTGDLVRLDGAGNYHFVGRRDLQVKSRGYRIELGDIEAVLYRHPTVAEAAVIARPHEQFGCTLLGIVAPRSGSKLTQIDLAAFCAEHLPPYMVPTDFELRVALPKTSSGKIDRTALQRDMGLEPISEVT